MGLDKIYISRKIKTQRQKKNEQSKLGFLTKEREEPKVGVDVQSNANYASAGSGWQVAEDFLSGGGEGGGGGFSSGGDGVQC
jgi:hypothetical protein